MEYPGVKIWAELSFVLVFIFLLHLANGLTNSGDGKSNSYQFNFPLVIDFWDWSKLWNDLCLVLQLGFSWHCVKLLTLLS